MNEKKSFAIELNAFSPNPDEWYSDDYLSEIYLTILPDLGKILLKPCFQFIFLALKKKCSEYQFKYRVGTVIPLEIDTKKKKNLHLFLEYRS